MNSELNMQVVSARYGQITTSGDKDLITKSLNFYGEWANNELNVHRKLIKEGDIVLDVGTYLGTHLTAYARFVGETGKVIGFEPHSESYRLASNTILINNFKNVRLNNFALGATRSFVDGTLGEDIESFNHGSFSLKNRMVKDNSNSTSQQNAFAEVVESDSDANNQNSDNNIEIQKLDDLELARVDFIKIDAEGMEFEVLQGGKNTIMRSKPIIFCECNDLSSGKETFKRAEEFGYKTYIVNIPAYNSSNFNKNSEDFFHGASEVSLVLVPVEKQATAIYAMRDYPFRQVTSTNDIFLTLLSKKQFIDELSYEDKNFLDYRRFNLDSSIKKFDVAEIRRTNSIILAVPFYKSSELVEPLYASLCKCSQDLVDYNVEVIFYNDSPDDTELENEFKRIEGLHCDFKISFLRNSVNLGFIGTMNQSISYAKKQHADIILLNSDTLFFPGVIQELVEVAYADPMIGFVSPRSNNATICTFPHKSKDISLSPDETYLQYMGVRSAFPRFTIVPTCVGFCLFIKSKIVQEFGLLDDIYGKGYNEENDYIMRANRCGYNAVLANHAFVWHEGEKSFSSLEVKRNLREEENAKILHERYPEFPRLIHNYFNSVEYRAESILEGLLPDSNNKLKIAFEFTSLGTYHNGTFEAGKKLIHAADKVWPDKYDIVLLCSEPSYVFHELKSSLSSRVSWSDPQHFDDKFAAIIRIGQPFSSQAISHNIYRAPISSCFMLDTIAADCGYLKLDFDENLWRFILNWADVIFTNSFFTASQFVRRYYINDGSVIKPSLHSITLEDYYKDVSAGINSLVKKESVEVLIIGNKFDHKALKYAVPLLSKSFSNCHFTVLGGEQYNLENVTSIATGQFSDAEIDAIYNRVDAIIFPSHYEGFGFPLLHSLAHKKKIFVRDLPVYHEIKDKIAVGGENIVFFESLDGLIKKISSDTLSWTGSEAVGEKDGWSRSAKEILLAVEDAMQKVSLSKVTERIRWFELAFCRNDSLSVNQANDTPTNIANRIAGKIQLVIVRLLRNQSFYNFSRKIWRTYKKASKK